MHKLFSARIVATSIIFVTAFFAVSLAEAENSDSWISSSISITKQADTISTPPTLGNYGNIDCAMEINAICSIPTPYGSATSNSTAKLSSSDSLLPVTTYVDGRQHFFPVLNSDTVISYFNGPTYGLNLAFNYNFSTSIEHSSGGLKIKNAPDARMTDKSNNLLAADISSISYSENGLWMIVSDPNVAMLRVNLQSFEVLPFGAGFNYMIGLDPSLKTAVTNDGRFALVTSKNLTSFRIYDLSTCASVPNSIIAPVACQSRDLNVIMKQEVSGFDSIISARFLNNDTLSTYAVYKSEGVNKIARFIISTNGLSGQINLLALGDSYISGEGAYDYMAGTDTAINKCHLSYLSYPYLIGHDLNYNSYHSVACSGAVSKDITNTSSNYKGQAGGKQISRLRLDERGLTSQYINSFTPGYLDQLDFVNEFQPKAITLSIGGNDMGFSDILKQCVDPRNIEPCFSRFEDRQELVRQVNTSVFPRLVQTYQELRTAGPPDMHIYIIGYPQIAKPGGDCALNVHLNSDEIEFSKQLIHYLNSVIKTAADKTGVFYVDTEDALDGHRLCEAEPGSIAMNGLTAGNDRPTSLGGPIADESYHPNSFGYQLLENKILSVTHNLTEPMPPVNLGAAIPEENGLELLDVPHSGRPINVTEFDQSIAGDLIYRNSSASISITGDVHGLLSNVTFVAELHSKPINLGNFTADKDGNISGQITIPANTPVGYHSLHFYGTDLSGQTIDIYKYIYIAGSPDDLDGNGISDNTQSCIGVIAAGVDSDKDGVDDSCDGEISLPPKIDYEASPTNNSSEASITLSSNTSLQNSVDSNAVLTTTILPGGIDTSKFITPGINMEKTPPSVLGASILGPKTAQKKHRNTTILWIGIASSLAGFGGILVRWIRI